jgi:hypothetical protein
MDDPRQEEPIDEFVQVVQGEGAVEEGHDGEGNPTGLRLSPNANDTEIPVTERRDAYA